MTNEQSYQEAKDRIGWNVTGRELAWVTALVTFLAVLIGWGASPASAAVRIDKNTVVIQESVGGEWDTALRQAVRFVDQYTGTRMVIGKCKTYAKRCITVAYGKPVNKNWVGQCGPDCGPSRPVSRIIVRKTWKGSGPIAAKKRLLAHEIAHAFRVDHNPKFTSVMYGWVYRNWKLSPWKFTAAEKRQLRRF